MSRSASARRFSDRSIRTKLFLSYLALVLFFLGLFLAINALVVTRESREQVRRSAEYVFAQATANLEFRTQSIRRLLQSLSTSANIQELFERPASYYEESIGRWAIDAQTLEKLIYPADRGPDVTSVRVYMKHGLAAIFENETIMGFERAAEAPWYDRFLTADRSIFWFGGDDEPGSIDPTAIHAVKSVRESQNVNAVSGLIQLDLPLRLLRATLDDSLLTERTVAFLANGAGEIVASAGRLNINSTEAFWAEASVARQSAANPEFWGTVVVDEKRYQFGSKPVDSSDWTFVLAVPEQDVARMSARPAQLMLVVFLVMSPLPAFLAFFVSRSATRRVHTLIGTMDRVVAGDFSVKLDPGNMDELGQLTERFNYMTLEIEQLLDQKFALGKEVKNLELRALQAQINPHFLYNTLDLINWMAVRCGSEDIAKVVEALSRFYRLSLSGGEDTVTLKDEFEHARTYIAIQNMRYEDRITLHEHLPQALVDQSILKLVIQPLVENSIFHGIMATPDETGSIWIEARRDHSDIAIRVTDDGVGVDEAAIEKILVGARSSYDHHGYGVRNIHERLQLNYGSRYGLKYRSRPGEGTTVEFRVPVGE